MLLTRSRNGSLLREWPDLSWFPFTEPTVRIEEYLQDDTYTIRAELPGVDASKDVDITYDHGYLHVRAVRSDEHREGARSEFRYGTFHRMVALPPGAKEDTIKATYHDGILTITVEVGEPRPLGRNIPVAIGQLNRDITEQETAS